MADPKRILFLASNPDDIGRIRFDKEHKEIKESLRRSKHRDSFVLEEAFAVSSRDMSRHILDFIPHILHFTGHGSKRGELIAEDAEGRQLITPAALGSLLGVFKDTIELVLLSACYSDQSADVILAHIPYVIGMKNAVKDTTAIEFAIGLYDAFGARGNRFTPENLEWAVTYAKATSHLGGADDHDLPIFRYNEALLSVAKEPIPGGSTTPGSGTNDLQAITHLAITEGLKPAADALFQLMQGQSFGRRDNDIIHLVGRINALNRDAQSGILRAQEKQVREAQLLASFNALMEELKEN